MKAMAAGKHVFMEKPLATTVERALSLRERAFSTGMILHCDHIMLYNPYYRYIKKLYDAGELGDLIYFDVEKLNLGPIRMDVNALMDLAVHDVYRTVSSIIRFAIGVRYVLIALLVVTVICARRSSREPGRW